jgi:hypothetical protein
MRKIMSLMLLVIEFAQRVFGELGRDVLGPPGDGKVIILDDSKEEEEMREEVITNTDAVPSVVVGRPSTLTASPVDADEDPETAPNDNSDGLALGLKMGKDNNGGDKAGLP